MLTWQAEGMSLADMMISCEEGLTGGSQPDRVTGTPTGVLTGSLRPEQGLRSCLFVVCVFGAGGVLPFQHGPLL